MRQWGRPDQLQPRRLPADAPVRGFIPTTRERRGGAPGQRRSYKMKKITPFAFLFFPLILIAGAASAQTGQTCGGIGGLQCPSGQGCLYPSGKCNQPDLAGTCIVVQDPCPSGGPQICGCDGTTYANKCEIAK